MKDDLFLNSVCGGQTDLSLLSYIAFLCRGRFWTVDAGNGAVQFSPGQCGAEWLQRRGRRCPWAWVQRRDWRGRFLNAWNRHFLYFFFSGTVFAWDFLVAFHGHYNFLTTVGPCPLFFIFTTIWLKYFFKIWFVSLCYFYWTFEGFGPSMLNNSFFLLFWKPLFKTFPVWN